MPIIKITEQDLTKPGEATESTDVVYVPGFINLDQDCLYEDTDPSADKFERGEYIGLPVRTPMLFKDVESFETLCGERPYIFQEDQRYSDLPYSFAENAIPSNDILIPKGTPDPGYILAKELLSAGLQVVFERIEADTLVGYKQIDREDMVNANALVFRPANAAQYMLSSDAFVPISMIDTLPTPPDTCYRKDAQNYTKLDGDVSSYLKEDDVYVPTTDMIYYLSDTAGEGDTTFVKIVSISGDTYFVPAANSGITIDTEPDTFITGHFTNVGVRGYGAATTVSINGICVGVNTVPLFSLTDNPDIELDPKYNRIHIYDTVTTYDYAVHQVYDFFESDAAFNPDDLTGLVDKGNYSVKYLTSGGYPVYEYHAGSVVNKMLNFAEKRGDCVALIDHTDNEERSLDTMAQDSLFKSLQDNKDSFGNGDFGSMFTPWCTYNRVSSDAKYFVEENGTEVAKNSPTSFRAPASYAYLAALADSIKTNANWLAIAGAARGSVLNLANGGVTRKIPNAVADKMQPRKEAISINPITEIRPYGQTIWGNRTLKFNEQDLVATSFLNIRNLISDVKKTCYRVARSLTFEQDTDVLWINFKSQISALLNRMQSGYGISGYKILRDTSRVEATTKATLCAKVILYPTYAVEDFYIDIILKDDEVIVE